MTQKKCLRIATRKSSLACCQAEHIKQLLAYHFPFLSLELLPLVTTGDKQLGSSLSIWGGKGLFVKELEKALLNGQADLAVHSMKDIPSYLEEGLVLAAISEREDPRDVLVTGSSKGLNSLKLGSRIGTSSLRRQSQLMALRPDLQVSPLRGNIESRLNKLALGEYRAIILAAAGLIRLKKETYISEYFDISDFLPAPGQGALGIECRADDNEVLSYLSVLNHQPTYYCVMAERALSRCLGGSCQLPLAAYAFFSSEDQICLQSLVGRPDGSLFVRIKKYAQINEFEKLGIIAAEALLAEGAEMIIKESLLHYKH